MKFLSDKKGESTVTGWVFPILIVGLLASVLGVMITSSSNLYDTSGYDNESLANYNYGTSLASDISDVNSQVDNLVVDANVFDYFAGVWNKIAAPFKTIYQSFNTVNTLTSQATNDLGLLPEFTNFLVASITLLVMILIIAIYINRRL